MKTISPLGDDTSSVKLIDHMGNDLRVANAARVSMDKESSLDYNPWPHDGVLREADGKLIRYLAKHNHWTPFSHPQITLLITMPIFVARQWYKHQVGFTRNEVSRRYVSDSPRCYVPTEWRKAAANVKQGSSAEVIENNDEWVTDCMHTLLYIDELYSDMIMAGVCAEQARMILPQSMYTSFYETASLAAYARLCMLRLDPHTQRETTAYATAVADIIGPLFPNSWAALTATEQ